MNDNAVFKFGLTGIWSRDVSEFGTWREVLNIGAPAMGFSVDAIEARIEGVLVDIDQKPHNGVTVFVSTKACSKG